MSQNGQNLPPREIPQLRKLPRPVHSRSESLAAGSWTKPHAHSWAQFTYASSGILEVRTSQGSHIVPPQRAVWVPPDTEHAVVSSGPALMRSLYIDSDAAPWVAEAPCRVLEVTPLARELILAVSALPADYPMDGPEGRLVAVLLDQLETLPEADFTLPFPVESRLAGICTALRNQPDDSRTLEELAGTAGMSARTLARLFEKETGLSFREWRLRLRLLLSLSGLQRGESVTSVSIDSGYESPSAFIAAFKRHFGRTPGEFFPS
nr:helix-turn-helix transcriptional regulator [Fundidesulfovibrio terrae]